MQDMDDESLLEPQANPVALTVPDVSSVDDETFNITHRSTADGIIVNPDQTHAEGWFDYTQIITKHDNIPGAKEGDQLYWRLYLPLPHTTQARIDALKELEDDNPGLNLGISLWELGQASPLLLNPL